MASTLHTSSAYSITSTPYLQFPLFAPFSRQDVQPLPTVTAGGGELAEIDNQRWCFGGFNLHQGVSLFCPTVLCCISHCTVTGRNYLSTACIRRMSHFTSRSTVGKSPFFNRWEQGHKPVVQRVEGSTTSNCNIDVL